jgi:hypothetical protein
MEPRSWYSGSPEHLTTVDVRARAQYLSEFDERGATILKSIEERHSADSRLE